MAGWVAILPKRPVINVNSVQGRLTSEMASFLLDAWRICADYETPAPEPQVYVRTNTLKRSWSREGPKWTVRDLVGIVKSSGNIAPYNVYVRGPKHKSPGQAAAMGRRGWQSIDQILAKMWPPQKRRFIAILKGRA